MKQNRKIQIQLIKNSFEVKYFYFILIYGLIITWSCSSTIIFSGKVTDGKNSIQGAIVRLQATEIKDISDTNGVFTLRIEGNYNSKMITAWKGGYYNAGIEISKLDSFDEIILIPLPQYDNPDYQWIDPTPNGNDNDKNCGNCHFPIVYEQWLKDAHSQSATNPLFLNIYNGTDAEGNHDVHPGYRLDYPHTYGNCSNCHAPVAAINNFLGADMNELKGIEKLGSSCDFCHKIKDVNLKNNFSSFTGVMHIEFLRPPKDHQIFFGSYDDVPFPDVYSPIYSKSVYCAPCHQGSFWGVPIYESYSEWLASPYSKKGIECQNCHMPPDGTTTNFAPGKGGLERNPLTIPTHLHLGSRDSSFLASTVEMKTYGKLVEDTLRVKIDIKNVGAGHHVPTDQPMRNMILLVKVVDAAGNKLKYIGKSRVPYWGGRGSQSEGNYEGLPGKGFAKILFDSSPQYVEPSKIGAKWKHIFPAPQWRLVNIIEDNRIPALETDSSQFDFLITDFKMPISISSELIYRRTFKNWANMKKWDLRDILIAKNIISIEHK